MCLMCEWYIDICYVPSCAKAARIRAGKDKRLSDEYYTSRSDKSSFLFKGYSDPCIHMVKDHGPDCSAVKRHETEYGMMYDSCNCWEQDGEWHYA